MDYVSSLHSLFFLITHLPSSTYFYLKYNSLADCCHVLHRVPVKQTTTGWKMHYVFFSGNRSSERAMRQGFFKQSENQPRKLEAGQLPTAETKTQIKPKHRSWELCVRGWRMNNRCTPHNSETEDYLLLRVDLLFPQSQLRQFLIHWNRWKLPGENRDENITPTSRNINRSLYCICKKEVCLLQSLSAVLTCSFVILQVFCGDQSKPQWILSTAW